VTTPIEPRPELDALLGAYALDALEPGERAQVEQYLETNPRARAEVDDLRETAAVLAAAPVSDTTAPPELWQRIVADVESDDAPPIDDGAADELAARRGRRVSRRTVWLTSALAAAAAIVAAVLAVQVFALNDDLDRERDLSAAYERAAEVDGARETDLLAGDDVVARVVVQPDGQGYFENVGLSALSESDEDYQLWAMLGDPNDPRVISVGVLGNAPGVTPFTFDGPVVGFAVSVEPEGGSEQPTTAPVSAGVFPA
jgi:anti-sigma-K factor RskA